MKSIDLQTAVHKSSDISRVKQIEDQQPKNQEQQFSQALQQEAEVKQQKPNAASNEEAKVSPEDGKDGRKGASGNPGESGDQREKGKTAKDRNEDLSKITGKGRIVDITVGEAL